MKRVFTLATAITLFSVCSFAQTYGGYCLGQNPASCSITVPAGSGNSLVAFVLGSASGMTTPVVTMGASTFTALGKVTTLGGTGSDSGEAFYLTGVSAGTYTVSCSSGCPGTNVAIYVVKIAQSSTFDAYGSYNTNTTSATTGSTSLTTTASGDFLVSAYLDGADGFQQSIPSGFTSIASLNFHYSTVAYQANAGAAGTKTTTWTFSPSGSRALLLTVAIKGNGATITGVSVTPSTPVINIGDTQQLACTASYSDGSSADCSSTATWSSSASSVASVSSSGLVTGVTGGSATITATYGGFSPTASVTVNPLDIYGGDPAHACSTSTGYFRAEKQGTDWWFCDPMGNRFWMQSVYNIGGTEGHTTDLGTTYDAIVAAKYGDNGPTFCPQALRRIRKWGFNSTAESSFTSIYCWPTQTYSGWPGSAQPVKVPMVASIDPSNHSITNALNALTERIKNVSLTVNGRRWSAITGAYSGAFPDLYDSKFATEVDAELATPEAAAWKTSPWTLFWTTDEGDYLAGIVGPSPGYPVSGGVGYQRNLGVMALLQSPVIHVNPTVPYTYPTATNYTKAALIAYLKTLYSNSISALNTAWGTSNYYTTFDSAGTAVTGESVGTGNGSTVTFNKTLAHTNVDPFSIAVKVAGTKVGGDCPEWNGDNVSGTICHYGSTGQGGFYGSASASPAISGGTVTYSSGVISITFATAPANTAAITVDYNYGGWGTGTGVSDEDGRHSWMPTNVTDTMTGATSGFKTAMLGFSQNIAHQYFSTVIPKIRAFDTNHMVFGPGVTGTWNGVPSSYVLTEASSSGVDGMNTTLWNDSTRAQAALDYWATNFGDKPLVLWHGAHSDADSAFWRYDGGSGTSCDDAGQCYTQAKRGTWYVGAQHTFLETKNTVFGSRPVVGIKWWDWYDQWNETSWGLVDLQDNAYDGVEDCDSTSHTAMGGHDAWGYTLYNEETVPSWASSTSYTGMAEYPNGNIPASGIKGSMIQAVSGGTRYLYRAIQTGTSGGSAPAFTATVGATTTDNGVIWRNVGAKPDQHCYGNFITPLSQANALWLGGAVLPSLSPSLLSGAASISGGVVVR